MNAALKQHLARTPSETGRRRLAPAGGLQLSLSMRAGSRPELTVSGQSTHFLEFRNIVAGSLLNRIDRLISDLPEEAAAAREHHRIKSRQLAAFQTRIGVPFEEEDRLARLQELRGELEALLSDKTTAKDAPSRAVATPQTDGGRPVDEGDILVVRYNGNIIEGNGKWQVVVRGVLKP